MLTLLRHPRVLPIFLLLLAALLGAFSLLYRAPKTPMGSGEALVGGPFTMVNHKGETVTEKNFNGKFALYFFGYTFCPDVCPTTLQVMTAALDELGAKADQVTPVFVSVDPPRDTVETVKNYIENFHPRMVGLTGTPEQLARMAKAYRVYYAKVDNPKRPQDYLMDHASILYLMGPDGKFVKHFSYSTDASKLAQELGDALSNAALQ